MTSVRKMALYNLLSSVCSCYTTSNMSEYATVFFLLPASDGKNTAVLIHTMVSERTLMCYFCSVHFCSVLPQPCTAWKCQSHVTCCFRIYAKMTQHHKVAACAHASINGPLVVHNDALYILPLSTSNFLRTSGECLQQCHWQDCSDCLWNEGTILSWRGWAVAPLWWSECKQEIRFRRQ